MSDRPRYKALRERLWYQDMMISIFNMIFNSMKAEIKEIIKNDSVERKRVKK